MSLSFTQVEVRDPSPRALAYARRGFAASSGAIALSGTSEQPILLLRNPSTNPVPLAVLLSRVVDLTSGHIATFRVYGAPTVTSAGTAVTPSPLRVNASAPASNALAYKSPTISANGALLATLGAGNNPSETQQPIVVDPGSDVLVTAQGTTSDNVSADLVYAES